MSVHQWHIGLTMPNSLLVRFLNLRKLKSSKIRDAEDSRKKTLWEQTQARLQGELSDDEDDAMETD